MTTFYLVRHGEKEKVMGNPPLSEVGQKQAELTAHFLKQFSITAIFSSPFLRTMQTADIIGSRLGVSVSTDDRLKERMNWGDKTGETFEEFLKEWGKGSMDRHYKPLHGNSSFDTGEMFKNFLLDAGKRYPNQEILIVTHGGTIGDFLLNTFTNLSLTTSVSGATYVKIWECSITTIHYDHGKFTLEKLGDVSHLPEPLL